MLQLTLMRHAKAESASEDKDDFDRMLAAVGREDAPVVAKALAEAGAAPELALVSDARRTRETWDLARPFFPKIDVRFLRSLYLTPAETLLEEAEKAGAERVMLVGHNPGLQDLASRFARGRTDLESKLRSKFPTSAGALFARKTIEASWKLQAFFTPKLLGRRDD